MTLMTLLRVKKVSLSRRVVFASLLLLFLLPHWIQFQCVPKLFAVMSIIGKQLLVQFFQELEVLRSQIFDQKFNVLPVWMWSATTNSQQKVLKPSHIRLNILLYWLQTFNDGQLADRTFFYEVKCRHALITKVPIVVIIALHITISTNKYFDRI